MAEPGILLIVALALTLAGTIKGVVGFGIQVVGLALLTLALDLLSAMAIMLLPAVATNVWQALYGAARRRLLRRLRSFLLAVFGAVFVGALALSRVQLTSLVALLGLVLVVYALLGLSDYRASVPARAEAWLGPLFGAANGLLMGMTGSSVVPGTLYLQALGLDRDALVQAMGMLYMAAALALMLAMSSYRLLNLELFLYSACAVPPALFGMWLGGRIRRRLGELHFQRVFFVGLLLLGAYLLVKSYA